ncbi:hypothetical protein DPMN_171653 [Dreissena polymorpha]|uniref:Uncharacterized protein n=1 Tax=Dreissena polymorpha TaxID=45954 RepID=A0A9D4E041_DREPO|nr:hypothetical protein DPMN_171653 [Dreissena polymorpha]
MVRLRSEHNRFNAHMHYKYRLVPSPTCPCGIEDRTAENILQRYKRHNQERSTKWPQDTTLHQELYVDMDVLRRTTSFIEETGLIM